MKKITLLLNCALLISMNINAQEGKPSMKIYSNFNYDISAEEGEQAFKEFDLKRAYLGYSYKIDDKFSTKITFDVGNNESGSAYTAFLKIASLKWNASNNLSLNFGMLGSKNFKFMEKTWGRRYIEKSAQDKYKWANSADLGVTADYKISDNISLDAQILNGEGYKKVQSTNGLFRGGVGLTYSLGDNLKLRLHQDVIPRSSYEEVNVSQTITTAAIAYTTDWITIGGETDMMQNADNIEDAEKNLMSVYGSLKLSDNYTFFARYDDATETDQEGSYTIYGIERNMAKGVTMALNMQSWTDAAEGSEAEQTLFLNLEYTF